MVGDYGPEHNSVFAIYKNRDKALIAFQEHRLYLLDQAKEYLQDSKDDAKKTLIGGVDIVGKPLDHHRIEYLKQESELGSEMYNRMVKNLSEEDPDKIDNYPQETPYLREEEVIE